MRTGRKAWPKPRFNQMYACHWFLHCMVHPFPSLSRGALSTKRELCHHHHHQHGRIWRPWTLPCCAAAQPMRQPRSHTIRRGFCSRHPDIKCYKKTMLGNWTQISNCKRRCQTEHDLEMQRKKLELLKLQKDSGIDLGQKVNNKNASYSIRRPVA